MLNTKRDEKEFFEIKEDKFFLNEVFSVIRKRPCVCTEKWKLNSVHYCRSGFFGSWRNLKIIESPLEKTNVNLGGLSVKKWLEEKKGSLYKSLETKEETMRRLSLEVGIEDG